MDLISLNPFTMLAAFGLTVLFAFLQKRRGGSWGQLAILLWMATVLIFLHLIGVSRFLFNLALIVMALSRMLSAFSKSDYLPEDAQPD